MYSYRANCQKYEGVGIVGARPQKRIRYKEEDIPVTKNYNEVLSDNCILK